MLKILVTFPLNVGQMVETAGEDSVRRRDRTALEQINSSDVSAFAPRAKQVTDEGNDRLRRKAKRKEKHLERTEAKRGKRNGIR